MYLSVRLSLLSLFAVMALLSSKSAWAQDYPNKPVHIIVPFGAGGPGDTYTRLIAQRLSEEFKQSFVVEPRPGGGATIGTDAVAKSNPDGYTLLVVSNAHTTNDSLMEKRRGSLMRDFVPVSGLNYSDMVLVINPGVQATTMKELIDLAKRSPGTINYASSGIGTAYHMAGELLKLMTGINIVHVPHKASGDMRTNVMGGHVQMMFDAVTSAATSMKDGSLRALAVGGKQRSAVIPDVPTISETVAPGYETLIWFGLMAPAGTPEEIINKLHSAVQRAMVHPDVQQLWDKQGVIPFRMSRSDFGAFLRNDIKKWDEVIKSAGIPLR